ncbi:MAG TPA: 50S ribosomal protein L21 [Solirubrobacteraceae bacterium]|jgi:large subunit ribosomal protein L21|nr:50S ribosomal protein L21 [Solirubrobacteraceae bacterium]
MYAIVKTGGKQYRVERGQRLLVERLPDAEGAQITLQPLLYRSEEAVLDAAGLQQVQVTAKVIEHVRGEKLRVFKFKPKRGYRRRTGHRQQLTRIEVTQIAAGKRKAAARGADAAAADQPAEAAAERATPVAAKRPAAKKAQPATAKAKAPAPAKKPAAAKAKAGTAEKKPAAAKASEGAAGERKTPAKARTKPKEDDDGS